MDSSLQGSAAKISMLLYMQRHVGLLQTFVAHSQSGLAMMDRGSTSNIPNATAGLPRCQQTHGGWYKDMYPMLALDCLKDDPVAYLKALLVMAG